MIGLELVGSENQCCCAPEDKKIRKDVLISLSDLAISHFGPTTADQFSLFEFSKTVQFQCVRRAHGGSRDQGNKLVRSIDFVYFDFDYWIEILINQAGDF